VPVRRRALFASRPQPHRDSHLMERYFRTTRSAWYSFVFVLPLLLLYHSSLLLANAGRSRGVVNGADALLYSLLDVAGLRGPLGWVGSWVVLTAVAGVVAYRLDPQHSRAPLRKEFFGAMLAESTLYALVLGTVVGTLTSLLLPGHSLLQMGGGLTWGQKLATSLGAGLYEELLFRLMLTGGVIWLLRQFGCKAAAAAAVAIAASSLVFSAFHYVGPYADAFQVTSFAFRFVAGAVLAGLYFARGFAVTAWTHALYDVFLLLAGRG